MDIRQLLDTVGAAVQDAHKAIAQNSADFYLNNFFEQDGESDEYIPKTVKIKLTSPEGNRVVTAPLATLINQGSLNIDSLKLNLNIEMSEQGENNFCVSPVGASANGEKAGELEILFKCTSTSEGAARVETHLNSLL